MLRIASFFTILVIGSIDLYGQKRTITGIMVNEDLVPVDDMRIFNSDSLILGTTDNHGKFIFDIPLEENLLIIRGVGIERKLIAVPKNCNHLEVILMGQASYDFLSLRRVNKLLKKRFKKLPKLHKVAFEKGVFLSERSCYEDKFILNDWK